jgi:hypothetical protein
MILGYIFEVELDGLGSVIETGQRLYVLTRRYRDC